MGRRRQTNPRLSRNHEYLDFGFVGQQSGSLSFFVFGPYQDLLTNNVQGMGYAWVDGCDGTHKGGMNGKSFDGLVISFDRFLDEEGIRGIPPKVVSKWNPFGTVFTFRVKDRKLADRLLLNGDVLDEVAERHGGEGKSDKQIYK